MDEEGGELRVARQDQSSLERGLGCGSLEGGLVRARGEVHRVVGGQLFGGARGGGDSGRRFAGYGCFAGARIGLRLGYDGGVTRDREGRFAARVVVGLAVEVDACGADLDAGGNRVRAVGQEGGKVYVLRGHAQLGVAVFAGAVAVDAGQGRHVHVQVADRRGGGRVEGDGACGQGRAVEALPFALADPVFEGRDGRLHLVAAHGSQRVDEAVAAVFLAVGGHLQARVVDGRLLAHEVDDLRARERGVRGLDERGDARDVRGRHRGAARLGVSARVLGGGDGGVDAVAGCREVNGGAVVGEVRAREGRPLGLGLLVDARESAHLADPRHLAGNADGSRDRTILDGRVHVGRRAGIGRRMIIVRALVASRGDDGQSLALRVGDGTGRGLQACGLLGIGRTPVHPRIHRVRVVNNVHAVAGRPHERAGHVLGVDELLGVGGLDRHEGSIRRDAVDADPVVVGGDNAGDVRAVEVVVTPTPVLLGGDAVGRARHGASLVHAPGQVRVHVVDTRVDDADTHRGVRDGHARRLGHVHGRSAPVRDLLGPVSLAQRPSASALHAAGLRARLGTALACAVPGLRRVGCGFGCRSGRRVGLLPGRGVGLLPGRGGLDTLHLGHGGHAGRANRVHRDPGPRQGLGHVRGERGRLTLCEERADLRVRGQGDAARGGEQGECAFQVGGSSTRVQVNRVVHKARARSSGGNQRGWVIGSGWWGCRRRDAHRQGESGDDPDACSVAAHGSSFRL